MSNQDYTRYKIPNVFDFYGDELNPKHYEAISKELQSSTKDPVLDAAFYKETPLLDLGYHPNEYVFILKASPITDSSVPEITKRAEELNYYDGDTMGFYIETVNSGSEAFEIDGVKYNTFKEYAYDALSVSGIIDKHETFGLRFIGVNAPEICHYAVEPMKETDDRNIKNYTWEKSDWDLTVATKNKLITDKSVKRVEGATYSFYVRKIHSNITYHEIVDNNFAGPETRTGWKWIKYVTKDDSLNTPLGLEAGLEAKKRTKELLLKAKDMRIMIDAKTIKSMGKNVVQDEFNDGFTNVIEHPINYMKEKWDKFYGENNYTYKGYNAYGKDKYRRFLGTIYIKIEIEGKDVWINLTKKLVSEFKEYYNILPSYDSSVEVSANYNFAPNAFKLWSYDPNRIYVADALKNISRESMDDRRKMQEHIMDRTFGDLLDWTVMLGDSMLMVPPTSIKIATQSIVERQPLMRSKGSAAKQSPTSNKMIELDLYFNGEDGINGIPVRYDLPNGTTTTYMMNGLRALISQFKFTPFLPIENEYINNTLNIEAVSLANFKIDTVPGYPKTLHAILLLEEFNYRVYMPEIITPDYSVPDYNLFSATISYPLMRWYYQRAIERGDELAKKTLTIDDYIKETLGERTALQPMNFKEPYIDFYLPDQEALDQLLQTKIESANRPISDYIDVTDTMKETAEIMKNNLNNLTNDPIWKNAETILSDISIASRESSKYETPQYTIPPTAILRMTGLQVPGITQEKIFDCFDTIYEKFRNTLTGIGQVTIGEEKSNNHAKWNFYIYPSNISNYEFKDLLQFHANQVSASSAMSKTYKKDLQEMQKQGAIKLSIAWGSPRKDQLKSYRFDESCLGFKILKKMGKGYETEEAIEKRKANLDIESFNSIKFDRYPLSKEDMIIVKQSVLLRNTMSKISTQYQDGNAPQFMGGQDTVLELTIQTQSEAVVSLLNDLPTLGARYMRRYRRILNVWPVRIDTEIAKMFGVNEVTIESAQVDTVPNQPGVFNINLTCVSVDRTQRNRESLKKVNDFANFGKKNGQEIANYFDLQKVLSQAELYPDLELPKLEEMKKETGYDFIRYSNEEFYRVYPDPDFYFVYGHVLGNQILRQSISDLINKSYSENVNFNLVDMYGSEGSFTPDPKQAGVKTKKGKDDEIEETAKEVAAKLKEIEKQNKVEKQANINSYSATAAFESSDENLYRWKVSEKLFCTFNHTIKRGSDMYKDSMEPQIENAIKTIDKELNRFITDADKNFSLEKYKHVTYRAPVNQQNKIENEIEDFLEDYFEDSDGLGHQLLANLKIDPKKEDSFYGDLTKLFLAMAMTQSAIQPYEKGKDTKYHALYAYSATKKEVKEEYALIGVPTALIVEEGARRPAKSLEDAMGKHTIDFGCFGIKKYDKQTIESFTNEQVTNKRIATYFLDPKYRNLDDDDKNLKTYKQLILVSPYYATYAYLRLLLMQLRKLLVDNLFITRQDVDKNLVDRITTHEGHSGNNVTFSYDTNIKTTLNLTAGRFFALMELSLDTTNRLYSDIKTAQYDKLNQFVNNAQYVSRNKLESQTSKFKNALYKTGLIDQLSEIGTYTTKAREKYTDYIENIYLEATDDPRVYLQHSFYDMMANDKRGRMLRAFPTYYMIFVDEGRKVGRWKLHDNFYNMSAIGEITVAKSRKIAADTCTVAMANMFKTYTTDDEDSKEGYKYDWRDVISSIYAPYTYALREEHRRLKAKNIERIKLQPGIRMHIRMGYGANANSLPIVFNGNIAEVNAGELVQIVAQGDGRELTNPILADVDAEDLHHEGEFFMKKWVNNVLTDGATPKTILTALLTYEGSYLNKVARYFTNDMFFNRNPYGITHFGDNGFNKTTGGIFTKGETIQNIYEATHGPVIGDNNEFTALQEKYASFDALELSTNMLNKSFWDILHICRSASMDYVASVIPFGLRSSVFYGAPRYYAAYAYAKQILNDGNSRIVELRKPFQQYHLYTSYSDIVHNAIKASDKEVKTCAIGSYKDVDTFSSDTMKQLDPMWVDIDIYPENQRTTMVDTQLYYKDEYLGIKNLYDEWIKEEDETGGKPSGLQIAWRMTANALKESIKDMYQGEMTVIGDPTVKPYDRCSIKDVYESMDGMFEVEAVVQVMSAQTGFLTSIYPDCISEIDDKMVKREIFTVQSFMTQAVAPYVALTGLSTMLGKDIKPLLSVANKYAAKGATLLDDSLIGLARLANKDLFFKDFKFANQVSKASNFAGLSGLGSDTHNFLRGIKNNDQLFKKLKNIKNLSKLEFDELITHYDELGEVLTKLDADDVLKGTANLRRQSGAVNLARTEISTFKNGIDDVLRSTALNDLKFSELDEITELLRSRSGSQYYAQTMKDLRVMEESFVGYNNKQKARALRELLQHCKGAGIDVQDVSKITNVLDDATKVLLKNTDDIVKLTESAASSKNIMKLTKLGFTTTAGTSFLSFITGAVIEMAIIWAVSKSIDNFLSRKLVNRQVLQIYPMKLNNRPMTAGLQGSKGLVVGSASYHEKSMVEGWLENIFDKEQHSGMFNFLVDLFTEDTKTRKVIDNILGDVHAAKENNEGITDNAKSIKIVNELNNQLAFEPTAYNKYLISDKFKIMSSAKKTQLSFNDRKVQLELEASVFNNISIKSDTKIGIDNKITKQMVPLQSSFSLYRPIKENNFVILHNRNFETNSKDVKDITTRLFYQGEQIDVKGYQTEMTTNTIIKDFPILRFSAYRLLDEIVKRYVSQVINNKKNKVGLVDLPISNLTKNIENENALILTSALVIGKNTWESTGLGFTLYSNNLKELKKILDNMLEEQKEIDSITGRKNISFSYVIIDSNNNALKNSSVNNSGKVKILTMPEQQEG